MVGDSFSFNQLINELLQHSFQWVILNFWSFHVIITPHLKNCKCSSYNSTPSYVPPKRNLSLFEFWYLDSSCLRCCCCCCFFGGTAKSLTVTRGTELTRWQSIRFNKGSVMHRAKAQRLSLLILLERIPGILMKLCSKESKDINWRLMQF